VPLYVAARPQGRFVQIQAQTVRRTWRHLHRHGVSDVMVCCGRFGRRTGDWRRRQVYGSSEIGVHLPRIWSLQWILHHHAANSVKEWADDIVDIRSATLIGLLMHVFHNSEDLRSIMEAAHVTCISESCNSVSSFDSPVAVIVQSSWAKYSPYCGFTDHAS
jgi:hypothetical protein